MAPLRSLVAIVVAITLEAVPLEAVRLLALVATIATSWRVRATARTTTTTTRLPSLVLMLLLLC